MKRAPEASGILLALLFSAALASAASAVSDEPVTVKGDQVEYVDSPRKIVATGNVVATYRDTKISCEQATIYMDTKDAYLRGRVLMSQPAGSLSGEEAVYNFGTRKGTVLGAEGEAGNWRSRGDRAEKISDSAFYYRGGHLTTCDFEEPHTRLQAKEIQVFLDDRIVLKHTVMYVGGMPLFYLPSYTHPLNDKRPRVTLIPGKKDEWGLFMLSAWRVYIHENLQGRLHLDYRERLGGAEGLDLKYRVPGYGEGVLRTYYTHERAIQRSHFYDKYLNEEDDLPTLERERYRIQARHRWQVDKQTQATLEFHRYKDPTVIKDFFPREFERDETPQSYFQVIRSAPWYGLTFLVKKRVNPFESVNQELPSLLFDVRPISLPWLPLLGARRERSAELGTANMPGWYYQSNNQYVHFNRNVPLEGNKESVLRFDTIQELFYSARTFRWLNVRPFTEFRQTSYSRGKVENGPQFRQAIAAGAELSTKLFRAFPVQGSFWGIEVNQLRHIITPSLEYRYDAKPTVSADKLLQFDSADGLSKGNRVTPSIEQKLQTKRLNENGQMASVDLARFLTTVSYDVEGAAGRGGRFGDVALDLETKPYKWLYAESDATFDPHTSEFATINADLIATAGKQGAGQQIGSTAVGQVGSSFSVSKGGIGDEPWAVGLGWRYKRDTSTQLVQETEFDLGKKWRIGFYHALDIKRFVPDTNNSSRIVKKIYDISEAEYRLQRDLHEWTVELVFNTRRGEGETILILFRLKEFPDLPFEFERGYNRPKAIRR